MSFAEQLKSSVDIVDVVGQYVRLRKAGPRWVGLCPFHTEKTPSFSVHGALQFYKCFGCGAGGDVIKFVMEIEALTFFEAITMLAERYGIPVPKRAAASDPPPATTSRPPMVRASPLDDQSGRRCTSTRGVMMLGRGRKNAPTTATARTWWRSAAGG